MSATFYMCQSDKRYAKKILTKVYEDVALTYIDTTDLGEPVLKVGKNIDPLRYNYVYIPEFNRYYYVKKPPKFEAGFYRVELHSDVLMSFYEYYKNRNVIVSRQERNYNLYQNDPKQHFYNTNATIIKEFPTKPFSITNSNFILVLNGASVANP